MFHLFLDYPNINFRYVVMPSSKLEQSSNYPYDFTLDEINSFINEGYTDGQNALNSGSKANIQLIKDHVNAQHRVSKKTRHTKKAKQVIDIWYIYMSDILW